MRGAGRAIFDRASGSSHVGSGEEAGIATIAHSIDEAHKSCAGFKTKIALEITAGQGSNLGYSFAQMGRIFDAIKENERLRLCFDTEHAFAAGYDFAELTRVTSAHSPNWTSTSESSAWSRFISTIRSSPFTRASIAIEHIGKGHLGVEPFERLLHDARFFGIPMCLENRAGPRHEGHRRGPRHAA